MNKVKLLGTEISLTTANNVNNATLVRLVNTNASAVLVTLQDGGTTMGTVTLAPNQAIFLIKQPAWTLSAPTALRAVSVAYND